LSLNVRAMTNTLEKYQTDKKYKDKEYREG